MRWCGTLAPVLIALPLAWGVLSVFFLRAMTRAAQKLWWWLRW